MTRSMGSSLARSQQLTATGANQAIVTKLEGGRVGGSRHNAEKKVKTILERWQPSSTGVPQPLSAGGVTLSKGMGRLGGDFIKKDCRKVLSTEKCNELGKRTTQEPGIGIKGLRKEKLTSTEKEGDSQGQVKQSERGCSSGTDRY